MAGKYKVITLCGSTRFKDAFLEVQKSLTLKGYIVISVGLFGHSGDEEVWEGMDEGAVTRTKQMLDDMHKQKIDMADEIFVINVGDYIGESTKGEIEYAKRHGKRVHYLEPHRVMTEEPYRSSAQDSDSDLEALDDFMRRSSQGPSAGVYSPDDATAAMMEYQSSADEEEEEESGDPGEAQKYFVLQMLQAGYDIPNTAYSLQMEEEEVRKIAEEAGIKEGENHDV